MEDEPELQIEVRHGDKRLASAPVNGIRADVASHYQSVAHSATSGFSVDLDLSPGSYDVDIIAVGKSKEERLTQATIRRFSAPQVAAAVSSPGVKNAPFPPAVLAAVNLLLPDASFDIGTDEGQNTFVDLLLTLLGDGEITRAAPIMNYVRFLRSVWKHSEFVDRYFPESNANRRVGDKDYAAKQSSAPEMISIMNHLYVLKASGVSGSFAEFGCFKGFSTSQLSYACQLLRIPMLVFDSFQGLPPSDSEYYQAGDFAGSLDEVRENVTRFGAVEMVTFHQGFFSDSLKRITVPPLISIFMDVDLETSAKDVMAAASKLLSKGALFSHECYPEHFKADRSIEPLPSSAGNVVPPIIDKFNELGSALAGRYIWADTGAFWRKTFGTPVASNSAVTKLARAL